MDGQPSSPQPPSQHWDHGRRSHPPQQQWNYNSGSVPPNYAVTYYMPEPRADVPVPSVPVPQQQPQPQPLRRFHSRYSFMADLCHTAEQVIAAVASRGVNISNLIIVDHPEIGGFSLYDDSPTSCTLWEEATTIIGQAQSKFGDGITSYAPGIETARVVQAGRDGQAGHCKCHRCRFLPSVGVNDGGPNGGNQFKWGKDPGENIGRLNGSGVGSIQGDKPWKQFFSGSWPYNDIFRWLQYPQSIGYGFSEIITLKGHQKAISGIAQPSGPDKLYSGSEDGTVKVWDRQTGQCVTTVRMGGEVGCMISEGPWLFVGIPGSIRVWNTQTGAEMSPSGFTGQVYALVVANDMLFVGTEDGRILVWRYSVNCFVPAASLVGHHHAVIALVVRGTKLYSGSMDHTIKVWDLTTLWCVQTLSNHTNVVMSLQCWEQFLISSSLDNTVKVWSTNNKEQLEVTYTHNEEHGVLALCGMHDLQGNPVLLCSLNNNSVRLYDLPSFNERGRIFEKQGVRTMQTGPRGIFFTGDGTGEMKVWQWST